VIVVMYLLVFRVCALSYFDHLIRIDRSIGEQRP
jgi:hypothetical protein